MTKTEIIEQIATKTETSKKKTSEIVDSLLEAISQALANNEKVSFANFGTFEVRVRSKRTGKNPQTGETIEIPEQNSPAFKAGKGLKDLVK